MIAFSWNFWSVCWANFVNEVKSVVDNGNVRNGYYKLAVDVFTIAV